MIILEFNLILCKVLQKTSSSVFRYILRDSRSNQKRQKVSTETRSIQIADQLFDSKSIPDERQNIFRRHDAGWYFLVLQTRNYGPKAAHVPPVKLTVLSGLKYIQKGYDVPNSTTRPYFFYVNTALS